MSILQDTNTASKLSDAVIAIDLLTMTKSEAVASAGFCVETITPELRAYFKKCLDQTLQAQEQLSQIAEKKEWYHAHLPPTKQLQEDLKFVKSLRQ